MASKSSSLSDDVHRPLDVKTLRRIWDSAPREYDYWVPASDIEGAIPPDLKGTLLRNGPGLNEIYGKRLQHPIDGDGMVVRLSFCNGRVHLKTRFVQTKERVHEQKSNRFLYRGQMGTHPNSAIRDTTSFVVGTLTGRPLDLQYRNPSNTNVFYWGGKVLTCYETGLPYAMDPYTLDTLGEEMFNGALKVKAFAAHFRLDMTQQRMVCMGMKPQLGPHKPCLYINEFDKSWNLLQQQVHHIEGLNYAHDFLLLPDYYVFHMTPFVQVDTFSIMKVVMGWSSPGEQMKFYPKLPCRFIVIPRHRQSKYQELQSFDTEQCHIFHFCTAKQIGDTITFSAVCFGPKFSMTGEEKYWLSNASVAPGRVYNFELNLATNECVRSDRPTDPASVEFPTVHPYRHGLPNSRFSYLMASDRPGKNLPYRDVIKLDAEGKERQVWYSHGCVGEPVFVPQLGLSSCQAGDDDDGYVITQLYIPETHRTEFIILRAKQVDHGPVAVIKLKHHIPYGFHGTFTPELFVHGQGSEDGHVSLLKAKL